MITQHETFIIQGLSAGVHEGLGANMQRNTQAAFTARSKATVTVELVSVHA